MSGDQPGTVTPLKEYPDYVEDVKPFPRVTGVWTLTLAMLESYSCKRTATTTEVRHDTADCGQLVHVVETGTQLADLAAALANHVCGRD